MNALGAYWHGDKFFILQEEAEQSLHDYLQGKGEEFDSEELWKQMKGVAGGLKTLHTLYEGTKIAYHQDLKPANILIVRRQLKIADFGLLEFKPLPSHEEDGSTGVPAAHNTGYYAAPRQGRYTRESDIWSLGCIMSELATCDIQGREEIQRYKEARMSDGPSGRDTPRFFFEKKVKKSVLRRHKDLDDCVHSSSFLLEPTASKSFQARFYTKEFFVLLNSMFKHGPDLSNLLEVPSEAAVPDAEQVEKTLATLRKSAVPTPVLDEQIESLNIAQETVNAEAWLSLTNTSLTQFKRILNHRNSDSFLTTNVTKLEQCIFNVQTKHLAERRQQGFKRLAPFLEKLKEFGELIQSVPDVSEFMGFIWVRRSPLHEFT